MEVRGEAPSAPNHEADRDRLLCDAVARARNSAFYARHLAGHRVNGRTDLAHLPLTFKHHLQAASPFGMLAVPPSQAWHYHESSGTTGEPISTWCGLAEVRLMAARLQRMVPEMSSDCILLNRFPLFAPVSFIFEDALRLEWTNPHARFYVDVKDPNGKVTSWNFELASPNVLRRLGWNRDMMKPGDVVTVKGHRAKDDSTWANANSVTLSDGRTMSAGSSADEAAAEATKAK